MPSMVKAAAWRLVRGAAAIALGLLTTAVAVGAQPVAEYRLGRGVATFGLALPQGAARGGVMVSSLPTQADVKTTWPDGSIRFAVVTTRVAAAGSYAVVAGPATSGGFTPTWPAGSVTFLINGETWVAHVPQLFEDTWLFGPLVKEARATVAPLLRGAPHPFLRVIFDVRSYAGGGSRLDVTVENALDVAAADRVTYDVSIAFGGRPVFQQAAVEHKYLARWRRVFLNGLDEATVTPDIGPFIAARAVPPFMPTIKGPIRSLQGPQFEILKTGDLTVPMNAHGGRPEIAPYPDWTAQYLVNRRADQRSYVLRHGELAGSWGIHIKEPDGISLISIDEHPNYWLDGRADADGRPKNGLRGRAEPGDNAHQPSLAYVPYLVTGDRFFLDEMKYWANYTLLWTFQDSHSKQRGGSQGLLQYNEVRGIGWALRNLADAAAYLPDNDRYRAYFRQKVVNNLTWLDQYATTLKTPFGTLFPGRRPEDADWKPYTWVALWEHTYVAWAVDHAMQQGFGPGGTVRDQIVRLQLRLFTSEPEGFRRTHAGAYVIAVGKREGQTFTYFDNMRDVFNATEQLGNLRPFQGYYGPEARLMLMIAMRQRLPGASTSYEYLMSDVGRDGVSTIADLEKRSGWAIAGDEAPPARASSGR
jgi:hypothetical protein